MQAAAPSDTATIIARGIVLASLDPSLEMLVEAGEAEAVRQMLGDRATRGWFGFAVRRSWCRRLMLTAEKRLLGGIVAHYLARKRWIEREVRRGINDGIRQVVVVGAGYDALAWRLSEEFPEVRFFEIDHPATQASKSATAGVPRGLHFLPADLTASLPAEAFERCPDFSREEPAFVIAEGLTMYFDGDRVAALLRSLATLAGREGRVLFTFMEKSEDGSIGFQGEHPLIGAWLRLRKEPFRWGCRRDTIEDFVSECGMKLLAVADHRDLRSEILSPRGVGGLALASGESLALCSVAES